VYGPWTIHGLVDDSFKVKGTFYLKQGGEYRLMPFTVPESDVCSAINNDQFAIPQIVEHSNFTLPVECPISNVSNLPNHYQNFHHFSSTENLGDQGIPTKCS
jgi:hypothetical protein